MSYGFALDGYGDVWVSTQNGDNGIAWLDRQNRRACSFTGVHTYGIATDYAGRVWLGSWSANSTIGYIFLPESKKFHHVQHWMDGSNFWDNTEGYIADSQHTRGAAGPSNSEIPFGYFGLSNGPSGVAKVKVLNPDQNNFDAKVEAIIRTDGTGVCSTEGASSGVSVDGEGDIWVIGMSACGHSEVDGRDHAGSVSMEINAEALSADDDGWVYPSSAEDAKKYVKSVSENGSSSYTYSDFLGQQFLTVVSPSGYYIHRMAGWGETDPLFTTEWVFVEVEAGPTDEPPLMVSWRVGDDPAEFDEYIGPFDMSCTLGTCTYELPDLQGVYLDVKFHIKTVDINESAILKSLKARGRKILK